MMNYNNIAERLPLLIKDLDTVKTEYTFEQKWIGQSQAFLALLLDIIENKQQEGKQ